MSMHIADAQGSRNIVAEFPLRELITLNAPEPRTITRADQASSDGFRVSLTHLDVDLAFTTKPLGDERSRPGSGSFQIFASSSIDAAHNSDAIDVGVRAGDPVVQRLAEALTLMESVDDTHSSICADALRLAILTRQYSRGMTPARGVVPTRESAATRNARALQPWRLKRVLDYIDQNLSARLTLQDLATVSGLSRMHFAAQFRAAIGVRPHEYLLQQRIRYAEELLKQATIPLVEVALSVGFQTQAHFTTVFKRIAGTTPSDWRSRYFLQEAPLPRARSSWD
ncbi:AraC-like DNA-binding protein [Tardiphaga robiniae]|uniref:AraC family transcriptional regulator n=1 Tax=Tardiphaga robiniae TaxID=943830 RepID=UPI002862ADC7|nr:AraC family transcriptional regulator [Tardiphaga robiniae]MDR6661295.1 AraC-like DNA-binding protein [Tardiphaga robiniae]